MYLAIPFITPIEAIDDGQIDKNVTILPAKHFVDSLG